MDCTYSLYERLATYRETLAQRGELPTKWEFAVGAQISLRKVLRNKAWFKGNFATEVRIQAARNEEEAFQIVVMPLHEKELEAIQTAGKPSPADADYKQWRKDDKAIGEAPLAAKSVTISAVTVSDLKSENGSVIPADRIDIRLVKYIKTQPPQYPVMHVGWWPDPLCDLEEFTVANPDLQPIWVEVDVPGGIPAGEYRGKATIVGPHTLSLDLVVEVWDFDIPEYPTFPTGGWALGGRVKKHGVEVFRRYVESLLEHGVTPRDCVQAYVDKELKDLTVHDENLSRFVTKGIKTFEINALKGEKLKQYWEHLKKKGWDHLMVVRYHDEPHPREYPSYISRYQEVKKLIPEIRICATEQPHPDMLGGADVWIGDVSAERPEWNAAARERGDSIWWYYCHLPIRAEYFAPIVHTPGMVVDLQAIDHRIIYWLAWKAKVDGVSYWAIASWPKGNDNWLKDGWKIHPRHKFPYSGEHNGNGYIVYPGDGKPIPSIRLKTIRDGLEDYDYLLVLRRALEAARSAEAETPAVREARRLLDVPAELAMSNHYYNRDPKALLEYRAKVANAIERLRARQK